MASKLFSNIIDLLEQPCDVTVSFKDFSLMLNGVFMLIIRPSISRFGVWSVGGSQSGRWPRAIEYCTWRCDVMLVAMMDWREILG